MNSAQAKTYMAMLKQGWEYTGRDGTGRVVIIKRLRPELVTDWAGRKYDKAIKAFIDKDGNVQEKTFA